MIPLWVLVGLFAVVTPLFYLALFREEGIVCVPRQLRPLALGTLIALGLNLGTRYYREFAEPSSSGSGTPSLLNVTLTIITLTSDIAPVLLLLLLYRNARDPRNGDDLPSGWLNFATKMALAAGGLILAGCLIRFAAIPFFYPQLQNQALQFSVAPPTITSILRETAR